MASQPTSTPTEGQDRRFGGSSSSQALTSDSPIKQRSEAKWRRLYEAPGFEASRLEPLDGGFAASILAAIAATP